MKLVFTYKELSPIKAIHPDLLRVGLIYKSHPLSNIDESEYSFVHKSIQEFLVAYHRYHCEGDSTAAVSNVIKKLLDLCDDLDDTDDDRLAYLVNIIQVWIMCDYLSLQKLSQLLREAFRKSEEYESAHNLVSLLVRALRHASLAPQTELPEPVEITSGNEGLIFQLPVYLVSQEGGNKPNLPTPTVRILRKDDRLQCNLSWPVSTQTLYVFDIDTGDSERVKIDAGEKSKQMTVLTYENKLPLVLKGPTVQHLEISSAGRTDITGLGKGIKSIEIFDSKLGGKGLWLAHTFISLDCQEISIQKCRLGGEDVQKITKYLQENDSSLAVQKFYFNRNYLCDAGEEIISLLRCMPRLKCLNLGNSSLSNEDKHLIEEYISGRKEQVNISMDDIVDSSSEEDSDWSTVDEDAEDSNGDANKAGHSGNSVPPKPGALSMHQVVAEELPCSSLRRKRSTSTSDEPVKKEAKLS